MFAPPLIIARLVWFEPFMLYGSPRKVRAQQWPLLLWRALSMPVSFAALEVWCGSPKTRVRPSDKCVHVPHGTAKADCGGDMPSRAIPASRPFLPARIDKKALRTAPVPFSDFSSNLASDRY